MARVPRWVYEGWPDPSQDVKKVCEWVEGLELPEPPEVEHGYVRVKVRSSRKSYEASWVERDGYEYRYVEVFGEGGLIVRFTVPDEGSVVWGWHSVKKETLEAYRKQWEVLATATIVRSNYAFLLNRLKELKQLCKEVPKEKVKLPEEERWW